MSGSLTADTVEAWQLESNDVKLLTEKKSVVDLGRRVSMGWAEDSDLAIVVQKRHFVGLLSHVEAAGDTGSSFSWYVGGGHTLSWSKVSYNGRGSAYVCTEDKIEIEDYINGSGWQRQVWQHLSQSERVAGSYWEEPIPEATE